MASVRPARWALLLAAMLAGAADDPPAFDEARQRPIAEQLDAKPALVRTYQQCPADVFHRDAPFWQRFLGKTSIPCQFCEQDPDKCMSQCFGWHEGRYCFALAQAFQYNVKDGGTNRHTEMLYTAACAAGHGAGCVNRAAGIRNGGLADDPFAGKDRKIRQRCEYRSFRIGCTGGDAWGCAMLGQAYGNGEGVPKDLGQARRYYGRSCAINPDFAACDFAKANLLSLFRRALSPP